MFFGDETAHFLEKPYQAQNKVLIEKGGTKDLAGFIGDGTDTLGWLEGGLLFRGRGGSGGKKELKLPVAEFPNEGGGLTFKTTTTNRHFLPGGSDPGKRSRHDFRIGKGGKEIKGTATRRKIGYTIGEKSGARERSPKDQCLSCVRYRRRSAATDKTFFKGGKDRGENSPNRTQTSNGTQGAVQSAV